MDMNLGLFSSDSESNEEETEIVIRRRRRHFRPRINFENVFGFKEKFRIYPETAEFILNNIGLDQINGCTTVITT